MVKVNLGKKSQQSKKITQKFVIDCQLPVEDNVILTSDFQKFLTERIKVEGKKGNLGDRVSVSTEGNNIVVVAHIAFSKRYLKYLSKKYLKKQDLREYLRVVATKKDTYQLRYFNIENNDADEEAE